MSLDIEGLLREISPDEPCGEYLEDSAEFFALDTKSQGKPADIFNNTPAQEPNWREVRSDALALLKRTHDLRIAMLLTQALIHTEGLPGLRDGLSYLRGLVERYWEQVYPRLDPEENNDPTERVTILTTLCDLEAVMQPVAAAPIVESPKLGRFSLRQLRIATGKLPAPKPPEEAPQLATIQAAFTDADIDSLRALNEIVIGSITDVTEIENVVTDRVGRSQAPNLSALNDLLKEIRHVLVEQLERRGVSEVVAGENLESSQAGEGIQASGQGPTVALGAINNRQDVVRALDLICDYYSRFEPSSPVPLLLLRAKKLACKDFMEIIKELAPAGLAQVQLVTGSDTESGSG